MIHNIGPTPEQKIYIAWMKDIERYEKLLAEADNKTLLYSWLGIGLGVVIGLLF